MSDAAPVSGTELAAMAASGRFVLDFHHRLAEAGTTILAVALEGAATEPWRHYPAGDAYDPASHTQYFFHAHPPAERQWGEAGHFHVFLRAGGMPAGVRPLVLPELAIPGHPAAPDGPLVPSAPEPAESGETEPWSHLAAVSIDASGWPTRLFTTNRWVTGETWYTAGDVAAMLERFAAASTPERPLDRWITALLGLYRPGIRELLRARDATVMGWRRRRRGKVHVFEDRRLEITSVLEISVAAELDRIEAALAAA